MTGFLPGVRTFAPPGGRARHVVRAGSRGVASSVSIKDGVELGFGQDRGCLWRLRLIGGDTCGID